MLCMLQSIAYANFSAAAPIFAMTRICGDMPGKPASYGLYWTGAGRSLRRFEMEDIKREQQQVFSLSLAGARSPGLAAGDVGYACNGRYNKMSPGAGKDIWPI